MRKWSVCLVAIPMLAVGSTVLSQQVGLSKRPGDSVRVTLTFQAPISASSTAFRFEMPRKDVQEQQQGFRTYFDGNQSNKLSDREIEISGTVGENNATGDYKLIWVMVTSEQISKRYDLGSDFQEEIVIRVNNPKHVSFAKIKEVTVQ